MKEQVPKPLRFLVMDIRGLYPFGRRRAEFKIVTAEPVIILGPRVVSSFVTDRAGLLELRFEIDEALRKEGKTCR